jgi:hypothetical protein
MADTQNTVYAQAYAQNVMQLAQQKYSKLMPICFQKPNVKAKVFYQDQIGKWSMAAKGGRNVQTPNNDPNMARRMGTMVDYHDARLLDRGDELRMLSDPRSAYTIAAAQSLARQIDTVIALQMVGTSYYGETGSSSITLGTDAISGISHIAGTPATLTIARLLSAKAILDREDVEAEDRFAVINPYGLQQLLNTTQITSADYNSVKALVMGDIDTFLGFKFIVSNVLSSSGTVTTGFIMQRYGFALAMGSEPIVRTDERNDLSYSWQVYYELNIGGVRLEEARVVKLDINDN